MSEISRKILCVDDEPNILEGLRRQLARAFDVTLAVGAQEGLKILEEEGPFAVIVTDYMMPEMNGVTFLQQAHPIAPHTVSVMFTGSTDLDVAIAALHEGHIFRFLSKPCPRELLFKTLNDCLGQYRLVMSERILKTELEKKVEERTSEVHRLYRFVSELSGLQTLEDVAELMVSTTAEILKSRRVSLMLPDESRKHLIVKAATGISDDVKEAVRVPVGAPISGLVFEQGRSIVVNEPGELDAGHDRYDTDFFASVPLVSTSLVTAGGPVGVLNVTDRTDGGGYNEESAAALKAIAEAGAIAISNQIRLQERNEARDATIFALAKLAEHRDQETGNHLERVQAYCRLLSETLSETPQYGSIIDKTFIETIVRSCPLHDIGKVGIPDEILLKPGRLTPEEFEVMKRHAAIGGDTIQSLIEQGRNQSFLQMGMEIARYHHEKFDGSGYPEGLTGENIPLAARIMAVADVYDALTSPRVYKPPMAHAEAVAIIRKDSGSHFDPQVVEAFLCLEKEFEQLAREAVYPDQEGTLQAPQHDAGPDIAEDSEDFFNEDSAPAGTDDWMLDPEPSPGALSPGHSH